MLEEVSSTEAAREWALPATWVMEAAISSMAEEVSSTAAAWPWAAWLSFSALTES